MNSQLPNNKKHVHLDMTPLVDVAFLLLTFFMLTAQFDNLSSSKLSLPKSKSGSLAPQVHNLTINLDELNQLSCRIESRTLTDSILFYKPNTSLKITSLQLDSLLSEVTQRDTTLQYIFRADKNIPFSQVNEIITLLKKNKIKKFNLLTDGN